MNDFLMFIFIVKLLVVYSFIKKIKANQRKNYSDLVLALVRLVMRLRNIGFSGLTNYF